MSIQSWLVCAGAVCGAAIALGQASQDPVAELNRKIQEGKLELKFDDAQGYLRSLLQALHIPIESQMAVFSKTSIQSLRIEPRTPRTLFFNDSVVVGWVRGGFIELAAQDPRQGFFFYALDERPWVHQERVAKPELRAEPLMTRRQDCLNCHISPATFNIPGALIRSVFAGADGIPVPGTPQYNTDHRTSFDKLWGGWYVTGDSGPLRHMGNAAVANASDAMKLELLPARFDPGAYLSPYSDIAALMVFEHQAHMMNLLALAGRDHTVIPERINELADYMLFLDEPALAGKVAGTSGFAEEFAARGPFDRKGRSLRQLDLEHRLMRYPCSYMIYSAAFDGLPAEIKGAIYRRLWQILSGESGSRLSAEDRRAVIEILRDTKPDLPGYFTAAIN